MTWVTTRSKDQIEAWAPNEETVRPFDPAGFSPSPDFDTGSTAGVWLAKISEAEVWTAE